MSARRLLADTKKFLDQKVDEYNRPKFIDKDPICIPHRFSRKQDIEIAGFFAAILAWGNRTTIINSVNNIMAAMHESPYDFILHHQEQDLKRFLEIKHRTFQTTDLLYFIEFLSFHYAKYESLEDAFCLDDAKDVKTRLSRFHHYFFSIEHPARTKKHISTPEKNSACKRLNMYLRWMVRQDNHGVDFGIWKRISMKELICPLDVHVCHVAYRLGFIESIKADWKQAEKLTAVLRTFDPQDPSKYDFALFGLGAEERVR